MTAPKVLGVEMTQARGAPYIWSVCFGALHAHVTQLDFPSGRTQFMWSVGGKTGYCDSFAEGPPAIERELLAIKNAIPSAEPTLADVQRNAGNPEFLRALIDSTKAGRCANCDGDGFVMGYDGPKPCHRCGATGKLAAIPAQSPTTRRSEP